MGYRHLEEGQDPRGSVETQAVRTDNVLPAAKIFSLDRHLPHVVWVGGKKERKKNDVNISRLISRRVRLLDY